MNRFESAAFATAIEALRGLLLSRDQLDAVRDDVPQRKELFQTRYAPLTHHQRQVQRATSGFFADYYASLSALSGVVARFSSIFHVNHSDNGPFLKWADGRLALPEGVFEELERARLFRALLAHPQQFPPYEWATVTTPKDPLIHILLYGPRGRGRNPIPVGAITDHPHAAQMPEWQFAAPDEVSVVNCVFTLAAVIFAEILATRGTASSFMRSVTVESARERMIPDNADNGWDARYSRGLFDTDSLPSARTIRPWH